MRQSSQDAKTMLLGSCLGVEHFKMCSYGVFHFMTDSLKLKDVVTRATFSEL